jgi:hypothetical protein
MPSRMIKREQEFKITMNSRVYKISKKTFLVSRNEFKTGILLFNKMLSANRKDLRCWKRYRNTQYRNVVKYFYK